MRPIIFLKDQLLHLVKTNGNSIPTKNLRFPVGGVPSLGGVWEISGTVFWLFKKNGGFIG